MLRAWLAAFIFTELVEIPIYFGGLRCSILAAAGASAITHPIVWFGFFTRRVHASYLTRVVTAELFAWLGEALYFRFLVRKTGRAPEARIAFLRALLWSGIANASSLGLGFLSRHLFGVP